jgi:hypothetical protein
MPDCADERPTGRDNGSNHAACTTIDILDC